MPDLSFQGTPKWWGGEAGVVQNLANRAHQVTTAPFEKYPNERLAKFNPLQEQSFAMGEKEVNNPLYSQLFDRSSGAIMNAMGQDITSQISPYIQNSIANPVENAQQYMNPYNDQVIQNIGKLASRNLTENILPNVNDQFIRSGSYGSSGGPGSRSHQDLTGRAIRDTQEGVSRAQSEALQSGYNKALDTSVGQQERNLQAGKLSGSVAAEDAQRQIVGGRELENLSAQHQGEMRQNTNFLGQLGSQQQQQEQQGLNKAYADFQEEKNYPYIQASRESELARGLTPGQWTSQTNSYVPQLPQASPWSQGAGLVAGATGILNQRPQGFSEGGTVQENNGKSHNSVAHLRHYADGGAVDLTPIQRGVNDALDTSEIRAMRSQANKLEQMQVDPFWSAVTRTGFNMASKRTPGVLANLGESMNEGMNEYQSQLTNQTNREMASTNLRSMIDNTLRLQAERNRNHDLAKEKFAHDKSYDFRKLGLEKEKFKHETSYKKEDLGLRKELLDYQKKLLEKKDKKEEGDLYKKSNEKAAEEIRASFSSLPSLKSNLKELKDVASKLDTGKIKGNISEYLPSMGDIPVVGGLIAAGESQDVDTFQAVKNQLVLDLGNQLKGSNIALGKLKIIDATKPSLTNTRKGNLGIINHMGDLIDLVEEKNKFMAEGLKQKKNAIDIENAFNQYADAKLEFEEKNPKEKFPNKPKDFLELSDLEGGNTIGDDGVDLTSMSDEDLRRIAGE